jgi:hypothetical protein
MKKRFNFQSFKTEEEAKQYVKNRRLRSYTLGYSEYWKCYIVTHYI